MEELSPQPKPLKFRILIAQRRLDPLKPELYYVNLRFKGLMWQAMRGGLLEFGCGPAPCKPAGRISVYFRYRELPLIRFCDVLTVSDDVVSQIAGVASLLQGNIAHAA